MELMTVATIAAFASPRGRGALRPAGWKLGAPSRTR